MTEQDVREGLRGAVHHVLVGDVAVSEDHEIDLQLGDSLAELAFGVDRHAVGVEAAGELRGVEPALDVGDLSGGKCHDSIGRIVAVGDVEVVKIAAGCTHDENTP